MTTVGADIKAYLTPAGNYTVNLGYIPEAQTSITIFETGGYSAEQVMGSGAAQYDRPSFQLRIQTQIIRKG